MEGVALFAVAIVAIVLLTLVPWGSRVTPAACLICGPHAGADAILNAVLFLPIGAALALLGTRWRIALAVSLAISVTVELLQLALPIGRVASVSDLVANVLGAAIGLHLTRRRRAILYPRSRTALRFAIGGASVWLLVLLITAVLLRPSFPGGQYYGQWRPVLGEVDERTARVITAIAGGLSVPDGLFASTDSVRTALRERTQVDLQAEFSAAGSGRLAGILRIVSDSGTEVMLVARRRHDLLFRTRMLATEFRFVTPAVMMFDALEGIHLAEPRLLTIEGRRDDGVLRLTAYGQETTLPLHSGLGWMFLVPSTSAIRHAAGLGSAIWVGLPLFAIAYWTGRRARRKARRAGDAFRLTGTGGQVLAALPVLAGLVAVGLAGISLLLGLSIPDESVWAGAALALGLGLLTGIAMALSRDDRAHGLSSSVTQPGGLHEPAAASGAFGVLQEVGRDALEDDLSRARDDRIG